MPKTSTISSKGQVTVPLEIRSRLGLREGDRVEFVVEGGQTIIRKERPPTNRFKKFIGALGGFSGGAKEINAWVAELRDPE